MGALIELDTTEIRRGDIVHHAGMRILIDVDPIISEPTGNPAGVKCYAWVGRVLNPDEAVTAGIPRSWMWVNAAGQPRTEPRWNVQGNRFAMWSVERPSA